MFWWMLTLFQTSFVSCSSYVGTQEGENAGIFHWFTVQSEQMKSVCELCSITPRHFDNLLTFFILWNNKWNIEHLSYGNLVAAVTHNSFFFKENKRDYFLKTKCQRICFNCFWSYIKQNISKWCIFAFIFMTVPTTLFQPFKVTSFIKEASLPGSSAPAVLLCPVPKRAATSK